MQRKMVVTGVRIGGIAAVAALALLLAVRLQARASDAKLESEFVQKVGPLDPQAYTSPSVPDSENAAIWLRAAAAALNLTRADKDFIGDLGRVPADQWTAEQDAGVDRLAARSAPALVLAERAALLPRSSLMLSGRDAVDIKYQVSLADLMWLARVIDERGRLAARRGDWAGFRSGVTELARIASTTEPESPLICQLVGLATERMMFDVIRAGVESPALGGAAWQGLDAEIPSVELVAAWRRALGAMATGVRVGIVDPHNLFDRESTKVDLAVPSPEEYLRIVLTVESLAARPIGLDAALGDRLQKGKGVTSGRPVADFLAGSLVRYQSILSMRRMARVAIGLRAYAVAKGRYPDTLAAWPEAAGPDPFTGGAMRYEVRADGSAVLAVPGAEELFNRINELKTTVPYTWVVSAPGPAVPATHD
ncbi:MAG TPA: hypothetical protein VMT19_07710 [Thermoanaerobaculaceae bacterium]|nr:hypothetical protein [Thermoanaerobaculaceae bacterium]